MLDINHLFSCLPNQINKVIVAYSGGIDSHVLLHLACHYQPFQSKITAVYVHHGLQQEADLWAEHCQAICLDLNINYQCIEVNAQKTAGQSQEEAARDARYQALQALLDTNDVLLVAQHREDQMETVLLQLFRGAGVKGLSGMPVSSVLGKGKKIRPMLDISKKQIIDYAKKNDLQWIEDPSNESNEFDRNFLRNQVLPQLKLRWPALDKTISRSARHCANSYQVSKNLAEELLENIIDPIDQTINITKLLMLGINKQQLVIRQWFIFFQLRMPSEKIVGRILNEVVAARVDANPEVKGQGYVIKRYREKLYCITTEQQIPVQTEQKWPAELKEITLANGNRLAITESKTGIPQAIWNEGNVSVKYRQGSETIKLPGRIGHHSLKKLFQEQSIPPWARNQIPLIYLGQQLIAIADLWISDSVYSEEKEDCYQINYLKLILIK